jgi:hypothetical protein
MNKKLNTFDSENSVKKDEHNRVVKEIEGKFIEKFKAHESEKHGLKERLEEILREHSENNEKSARESKFRDEEKKLLIKQVADLNAVVQKFKNDQMQMKV